MCGIAGFVSSSSKWFSRETLKSVSDQLTHRGPDDVGYLTWNDGEAAMLGKDHQHINAGKVAFIHRRLSIIELSHAGWQPMTNQLETMYTVFNGEIYNYKEIKSELERCGYTFSSESDTEVILAAYGQWGEECFIRFVGMFSFAILDCVKNKVVLARDLFGIKPLYYSRTSAGIAFSSEIKALLQFPQISRIVDAQTAHDFLNFGRQERVGRTFFRDIKELPPAHYVSIDLDKISDFDPVKYWNLNIQENKTLSKAEAAKKLRNLFVKSVDLHMLSDVPIAATLSGGIDSSSIVMAMSELNAGQKELNTISYIADEEAINEEKWIDIVNERSGARANKVKPGHIDLIQALDKMIEAQEQPVGSTSAFAQYRVFQEINKLGYNSSRVTD